MTEDASRTLVCSIVFVDIVGYSRHSVDAQVRLRHLLNVMIADALARVRQWDRIILDTGDGAAIAFLGDPEDALIAAIAMRDAAADPPLRMGIHLGPVRLLKDLNGRTNLVGDGINAAQRVMSFAQPGQLLASRSFYDVLARLSDEHARLFSREGLRLDKHVREHEVFAVVGGTARAPRADPDAVARVFDAGPYLIVSGYSRAKLVQALDALERKGARVVSPIEQIGDRWMATCRHPDAHLQECTIATLGLKRIVTGPTRDAVARKVAELQATGDRLVGDIEQTEEGWTAVCDSAAGAR